MSNKQAKIKFPVWRYLNQPLFSSKSKLVLNPQKFWYLYRIELLERCLAKKCESEGRHYN